jgi:hypothetical protein
VGGGVAYDLEPWAFGLQYSRGRFEIAAEDPDEDDRFLDSGDNFTLNRVVGVAELALGPGIKLDAELGYTWTDADGNRDLGEADNYHAFEIGLGTAIEF